MKLQLEGQRLRVRVGEAEFAELLAGRALDAHTQLPHGPCWSLRLQPVADGTLSVGPGDPPRLLLPLRLLEEYRGRLPCRDGIEAVQQAGDLPPLQLVFEVDVRDSVRTRGPRRRQENTDEDPD